MKILDTLININTASGAENAISEAIKEYLVPVSDSITTDKCGNLIVCIDGGALDGKKEKTAVFASVDAPGLVVTYIEENGNIRVAPAGKCDWRSVCFSKVTNGNSSGILVPDSADSSNVDKAHVYFGFKDRAEAETHLRQGDVLFFESVPVRLANGLLSAPGLGSKVCAAAVCATALEIKKQPGKCYYFVFCVQSELGFRGSYQAAYGIDADNALCLEPYSGKDFAVKVCDRSVVCDEKLTSAVEGAAKKRGIEIKRYVSADGMSDASRVQSAGDGTKTAVLLLPSKNLGTLNETVDQSNADTLSRIIEEFLNNI